MSPVFHREKGYVFKVYSNEEDRKHIHVIKADKEAKLWLEPNVELDTNYGFTTKEVTEIKDIINEHADDLRYKYAIHVGRRAND
jgi:hypothetical protein